MTPFPTRPEKSDTATKRCARVLLVDDNPRLIPLLKRTVEAAGLQAIICTNGQQAWTYLSENHSSIDLMVTDLSMPFITGHQLIEKVYRAGWDLPIIVLSAQTHECDPQMLMRLGVKAVLIKPQGVRDLTTKIIEVLRESGRLHEVAPEPASEPDLPTVLIVEDDPVLSIVLGDVLKKKLHGARVLSCSTLQQGHHLIESFAINLLITDLNLPDGNALGLICSLLDAQPHAHVILTTASRVPFLKQRSEALGLIRFLEKPIQPLELADMANSALARPGTFLRPVTTRFPKMMSKNIGSEAGVLRSVVPLTDLQQRCTAKGSYNITYYVEASEPASISISEGELICASVGKLKGFEALVEIASWETAFVEESELCSPVIPNLPHRRWQSILVDAVRSDVRLSRIPPTQVGASRWRQRN